jgi:imidazole glycerol-phosphate synthase subunit HisH
MIAIVNYGLGNVHAIANIYNRLNIDVCIASTADDLKKADRVILPGVGAFDWAMTRLNASGMRELLEDLVVGQGRPVLGICVGMQMMAHKSEEGVLDGLGWIGGKVKRFETGSCRAKMRLPHMGWNDVEAACDNGLFHGLGNSARFYFLHSYFFHTHDQNHVYACTDYFGAFASSVRSNNVYGVQFHPEKSHQWGIQLLKNFSGI